MAVIKITSFGGEYPSVLPRNLIPEAAQMAQNLQAQTAEFRPVAASEFVVTAPVTGTLPAGTAPKTIYRAVRNADESLNLTRNVGWRATAKHVRIAKSPLDDNLTDRNYATTEDGSEPPVAFDAQGALRQLGVPAPDTAPTCVLKEGDTFTPEARVTAIDAAVASLITRLQDEVVTSAVVGYDPAPTDAGWVRDLEFSGQTDLSKQVDVWRVFAVDPVTDELIATYSPNLAVEDAAWIFDPSLNGKYVTAGAGVTLPTWAAGHTKWWGIKLRSRYGTYSIDVPQTKTILRAIELPGTETAEKWLTEDDVDVMADRLVARFDSKDTLVAGQVDDLLQAQAEAKELLEGGGAATTKKAVEAFYALPRVQAAIDAAKLVWANEIWNMAVAVATAKTVTAGATSWTDAAVKNWFDTFPNATTQEITATLATFNIPVEQVARIKGISIPLATSLYYSNN